MNNDNKVLNHGDLIIEECIIENSAVISKELIARLNSACDAVEDAGENGALALHLEGTQENAQDEDTPVDVYLVSKWEKTLRRVEQLRAPVFCAAEGSVRDQGLAVLLTSDYRFAEPDSHFSLSCNKGQILPGTSIQRLVHQIGSGSARKLVFFGDQFDANRALTCGLVDEIVDGAYDGLCRWLIDLDRRRFHDIAVRRQLLLEANAMTYEQALGSYLAACDRQLRQDAQQSAPDDNANA